MFATHKMAELKFIFAVPPSHPLACLQGTVEVEHLRQYPAIVVADTSQLLPVRDSGLFNSKQVIRVNTMASKLAAQLRGIGVGYLPLHLAQPYLLSGELIQKEIAIPRAAQSLYIAWNKNHSGKAFEWFISKLKNVDWNM